MDISIPVIAGSTSTVIFAVSTLPMLIKAGRSKSMSSYSFGNIVLANIGNAVHSVYIFSLPFGPVWVLHIFYLVSTVLMLVWYLRYEKARGPRRPVSDPGDAVRVPEEHPAVAGQL
ncbi:PQ-loop repeat-containing protein [Paramicrobacterium fandaimingii]|uniref:PQ-loop repeat-containing protein n=1 Tax=Paramicrobacterium fandaimingii TaxID=2708079 RepID=UPI001F3C758E|nr:PQ-loop repeat-containing protein [Microbacterium fandaimingii]